MTRIDLLRFTLRTVSILQIYARDHRNRHVDPESYLSGYDLGVKETKRAFEELELVIDSGKEEDLTNKFTTSRRQGINTPVL